MATETTNFGLRKPATTDNVSVLDDIGGNMEIIDSELGKIESSLAVVQQGTTATVNISAGRFVLWNGVLHIANEAISQGGALATKLTQVSGGGFNLLYKAVVVQEYTYSYSSLADGGYLAISASDFGITDKPGYTLAGVVGYATGSYNVYAYGVLPRTTGTVMSLRNKSGTSISTSVTCRVTYLWVRSELM